MHRCKEIQFPQIGAVVQLVRIQACHAWGRGFESRPHRNNIRKPLKINSFQGLFLSRSQRGDQSDDTLFETLSRLAGVKHTDTQEDKHHTHRQEQQGAYNGIARIEKSDEYSADSRSDRRTQIGGQQV